MNWSRAYALTVHYDSYVQIGLKVPKPSKFKHILAAPMPEIFLCAIREVLRPMVTPDGRMLIPDPDKIFLPTYCLQPANKLRNGANIGFLDPDMVRYGIMFYPGLTQSIYAVFKGVNIISNLSREGLAFIKASFACYTDTKLIAAPVAIKTTQRVFNDNHKENKTAYVEKADKSMSFKNCEFFIHDFTDEEEAKVQFTARLLQPLRVGLPERIDVDVLGAPVQVPDLQFLGEFAFRDHFCITNHSFYCNIQTMMEGDYTPRHVRALMSSIMTQWSDDLREFYWPTLGKQVVTEPSAPLIGEGPTRRKKRFAIRAKKQSSEPTGKLMVSQKEDAIQADPQ